MGNCATKPKTKGDDEAPPPPAPERPAEGERKDEKVDAPEEAQGHVEEASRDVVAPPSEEQEAATTVVATAETKEPDELKEAPNDDDSDHDKVKETAGAEAELPVASTPAKVD